MTLFACRFTNFPPPFATLLFLFPNMNYVLRPTMDLLELYDFDNTTWSGGVVDEEMAAAPSFEQQQHQIPDAAAQQQDNETRQQLARALSELDLGEDDDNAEGDESMLDATIAAVQLSPEERKKIKNKRKSLKRRQKQLARNKENRGHVAAGRKSRYEVAEENYKRKVEAMVARERGKLRQEAEADIEERLAFLRADLMSGRVHVNHKMNAGKEDKRRQLQKEHQRRRNAERQRVRRQVNGGFAAVGKALVYGVPGVSAADSALIDAELVQPSFADGYGHPPTFEEEPPPYNDNWEEMQEVPVRARPVAAIKPRVVECVDLRD